MLVIFFCDKIFNRPFNYYVMVGVFVSAWRGDFCIFYKHTRIIAAILVNWPHWFWRRGEKSSREVNFIQKQIHLQEK